MNLSDRLHKLHSQRNTLIARCARKRQDNRTRHKALSADEKDLVRVTCKVLKFELKAEKVK